MLAPEGRNHILIALAAAIALFFVNAWLFVLGLLALAFVLQFFRDPQRKIKPGDDKYLAPADGAIVFAGPAPDPGNDGADSIKVSIFMNVFNAHANRIPVAGKIVHTEHRPGKFFNASLDKASEQNEANTIIIETEDGRRITVVQIAGLLARRIFCYVKEGDVVELGQRYGFIRFGSRVDVYLPPKSSLFAQVGDAVHAGLDRIAVRPPTY